MSATRDVRLVHDGGTAYERGAMGIVAASFVTLVLAVGMLVGWVPLTRTLGGQSVATYFGGGVVALGLATGTLGVVSRWGGIRTTPDRTPGIGMGVLQTGLWLSVAGLVFGTTLGFGGVGWLLALPVGLLAGYLTIGLREDVGATLPTAVFICFVGAVIATGVITPGWTWEPSGYHATIPGTIVIPLLTLFASLLASWTGAAAHEGFGTRGRQNGAFLLISLVVFLVLSVLVFLLVFVFERGIAVLAENLDVGAGTILFVLATTLVVLVTRSNLNPARATGTEKSITFVYLGVTVLLGLLCTALALAIGTNYAVSGYSVTLEPTTAVGAVPGLVLGGLLLRELHRSTADWHPDTATGRRVRSGLKLATRALVGIAMVQTLVWTELAVGIAVVPLAAALVGAIAIGGMALNGGTHLTDARPAWIPPVSTLGGVGLVAFLVGCLHVIVAGEALGVASVELVASGTIQWPFVTNPSQGLGIQKGVMPAMFGTIWIVLGAVVFAVPLAVGAAVFLTEYAEDSIFTRAVDVATNGLWSTPSIVYGLFGLAFLVPRFGDSPSIFVTQLVLGFMLLPLVLITSREAMKSVPDEYRDASAALGVSKWDTIRSVVIPAAMPGVITGVILGVGRIAGETAPLLLVLNGPNFPNSGPSVLASFTVDVGMQPPFVQVTNPALLERASALPYQLYAVITAGVGAEESFGWGTALVLLAVVLAFFAMGIASRRYFRKKLHQ